MLAKKILIISTYPIKNPQHGGQKRLSALVKELRRAGMDVKHIAVFHPDHYQYCDKDDIPVRGELIQKINQSPFTGDIECGKAIFKNAYIKRKVVNLMKRFNPDIISIEQAFPYMGIKPLLKEMNVKPKIIFGSHNIEYKMKEEMLNSLSYHPKDVLRITEEIKQTEVQLAKDARLISAVSDSDASELKKLGVKDCIIAPNGVYSYRAKTEDVNYWKQVFEKIGVSKIMLFVGSAHPPNWIGFQDMVGRSLGFLPKEVRMVFAGSIADYVQHELYKMPLDIGAVTFGKRSYFAGRLSEERLIGLISFAQTIVLPITEGGGSNLKTAEAIMSGKNIVATTYAFRGFDKLKKLSGVYLADNSNDFKKNLLNSLELPSPKRTPTEIKLQQTVEWSQCLKPLVEEVKVL